MKGAGASPNARYQKGTGANPRARYQKVTGAVSFLWKRTRYITQNRRLPAGYWCGYQLVAGANPRARYQKGTGDTFSAFVCIVIDIVIDIIKS